MEVPESLSLAFGPEFEKKITEFACRQGFLPDPENIQSQRFIARSVVPHVQKLSRLFNREEKDQAASLTPYWKSSSNPKHLRWAYFLYFMPSNLYRMASIWAELSRLGFQWPSKDLRAIEFGAGPGSGVCGIAAGEKYAPVGLPSAANFAMVEQDKAILSLGQDWAAEYFSFLNFPEWSTRSFHRKLDLGQGFLPPSAPEFNLWLMSFYLNEISSPPAEIAEALLKSWKHHLSNEGLIIIVEPALKAQSRKLLELRKALLAEKQKKKIDWLQILLPCLGHQTCGALDNPEDWCHEEVSWWRPPYFKKIDQMAGLDRKTLPFSYLVLMKSTRPREEILSSLKPGKTYHRLVSPSHFEGQDSEFFICGQDGKRRARMRTKELVGRGNILENAEIRGDVQASRIDKAGIVSSKKE